LREKASAAALVSEVVGIGILDLLGVRTLEPALVEVTDQWILSDDAASGDVYAAIEPGLHFGTLLRLDFFPAQMDRPEQVT
jgi:hypothetical protein